MNIVIGTGYLDCHVHIDQIGIKHPLAIRQFNEYVDANGIWYPASTVETYVQYIQEEGIKRMFALYDNPERLIAFRNAALECKIDGFLWVHNPRDFNSDTANNLIKQGLLQGFKLHPVFDRYEITTDNLGSVLDIAKDYQIPILFHSDDLLEIMYLTAPGLQEALVRHNPDVNTIIGHAGAYVPNMDQWPDHVVKDYWHGGIYQPKELIERALTLAHDYPNVFCDLTIITNPRKANIIINFIEDHPKVVTKILLGIDFPIDSASLHKQVEALQKGGLSDVFLNKLISNRLP